MKNFIGLHENIPLEVVPSKLSNDLYKQKCSKCGDNKFNVSGRRRCTCIINKELLSKPMGI